MAKKKAVAEILCQEKIADGIYSMWFQFPGEMDVASEAIPGQFISLYCKEGGRLLPRPISICEIDQANHSLRIVYRVAGAGTNEFSTLQKKEKISVVGPLGNGFTRQAGRAILIGGGIGIPPMLELAKTLHKEGVDVSVVLGYRDSQMFLKDEFEAYARVYVSTEDGSVGIKGNVIDAICEYKLEADTIYSCGPIPMLRGVKAYAARHHIKAQISMEEKMACGIGACLACVCQSKEVDGHSHVHNKRVCADGPVFDAEEIEL